jgi:hypothetical protein
VAGGEGARVVGAAAQRRERAAFARGPQTSLFSTLPPSKLTAAPPWTLPRSRMRRRPRHLSPHRQLQLQLQASQTHSELQVSSRSAGAGPLDKGWIRGNERNVRLSWSNRTVASVGKQKQQQQGGRSWLLHCVGGWLLMPAPSSCPALDSLSTSHLMLPVCLCHPPTPQAQRPAPASTHSAPAPRKPLASWLAPWHHPWPCGCCRSVSGG